MLTDIIQNYLHDFSEVVENLEMWKNADDDFHSGKSENVDRIIKEMTNPVKEVENHDSN